MTVPPWHLFNGVELGDEVIYEHKRWEVVNTRLATQEVGGPHKPNHLRIWRAATGEGRWVPADSSVIRVGRTSRVQGGTGP